MYGIVTYYCIQNTKIVKMKKRFDNVDCLVFQEKKKYFFEKQYKNKGLHYRIVGSKHFKYTGKTMEVEV